LNKNIAKKEKKRKAERDPIRQKKKPRQKEQTTIYAPTKLQAWFQFLAFSSSSSSSSSASTGPKKTKVGYKTLALKRKRPTITFSTFDTHKKAEERNRSRLWKQAAADNRERTD